MGANRAAASYKFEKAFRYYYYSNPFGDPINSSHSFTKLEIVFQTKLNRKYERSSRVPLRAKNIS